MSTLETPVSIMMAAYIKEVEKYEFAPRNMKQMTEAGFRAALRALAAMAPATERMIQAAYDAAELDERWRIEDYADFECAAKAWLNAAADEGEEKP